MESSLIIPSAEPFLFTGGKTGCVLVHGFTGTPKEMRLMGEYLHNKGLTVLGIRLAGHATKPLDLIRTNWQDWLASMEDGINILKCACEKVFVAGLSLGGTLSLIGASRYNLQGAVAIATPYELPRDWRLNFARPLSKIIPYIEKKPEEVRDQEISKNHVDYPAYPTRAIVELNDLIKIFHKTLPGIGIPVFLINSDSDPTVPESHADKIQQEISLVNVERLLIKDSGHVITEDIDRDKVFSAVYNFIRRNSK